MTENATNSSLGPDQGYSELDGINRWVILAENLDPAPIDSISWITIMFGGLGSYSGNLWTSRFLWSNGLPTNHGDAATFSGTAPCPTIRSITITSTENIIQWSGPSGNYYVYRSQNGSGSDPDNGLSSGVYYYLNTVTGTTTSGSYTDTTGVGYSNWYIVVHANSSTGAIDGCHSEIAQPTAVDVWGFVAAPQAARAIVNLGWDTTKEISVAGFNVYRALKGDDSRQRINTSLISVQNPGCNLGSHYVFNDTGVQSGQTYEYWVEILKFGSESKLYGPQEVTAPYGYFMPLVRH
jgi:hypothetical protein